jgi:hypothetical protein
MRGTADVAVARAVADLRILSELCIPYVRRGGLFVAPKGPSPEEEVEAAARAIEVLGARVLGLEKGETTLLLLFPFSYLPTSFPETVVLKRPPLQEEVWPRVRSKSWGPEF